MGFSFHDDSPAASWFRANRNEIAGVYKVLITGRYSQIERPEYAAIIRDIQELEDPDIDQCLTLLGCPTTKLVTNQCLALICLRHSNKREDISKSLWRLRYPKYQPQLPQATRPKVLQPGDEFLLIDLLDGTAVLPEGAKDFERLSMLQTWVGFEDLDSQGYFKSIRDREYVYRIAPAKRKPLPSEVSALLDEVPEFKTRLTELGYDLGQPV